MPDFIKILPPHVANQIAAGEAVQRPASVVKELMENSVDAGSMSVTVVVTDGGTSLIQVTDNGMGMSSEDARNAFVRHATSKIKDATDLFNLHTFGFRGEALASIAAVAEVSLRTRRADDTLGTEISISGGSEPEIREINCAKGTTITVRNLFYNIPARRKFLKTPAYETKLITAEFQRVALVNPDIAFTLIINGEKPMFALAAGNLHQRITALTSKGMGNSLLPIDAQTPVVRLSGYIGTPKTARKSCTETFFFVNGRYIRSPYLHKAVIGGYNKLIAPDTSSSYFIYIEVDPGRIDVNIHPTKTEIKFEDDQVIWQIVNSAIRETLGKHNIVPTLDFESDLQLEIPVYRKSDSENVSLPATSVSENYNPFKSYERNDWNRQTPRKAPWGDDPEKAPFTETLPADLMTATRNSSAPLAIEDYSAYTENPPLQSSFEQEIPAQSDAIVFDGKYIITTTVDGIVIVNYHRALQRITYERVLNNIGRNEVASQRQLHPVNLSLSKSDHRLLMDYADQLSSLGFEISDMGGDDIAVYGVPAELAGHIDPAGAIDDLIEQIKQFGSIDHRQRIESLAKVLSKIERKETKTNLSPAEASQIVNQLLATGEPNYTPDSLPVIEIIGRTELEKRFKK